MLLCDTKTVIRMVVASCARTQKDVQQRVQGSITIEQHASSNRTAAELGMEHSAFNGSDSSSRSSGILYLQGAVTAGAGTASKASLAQNCSRVSRCGGSWMVIDAKYTASFLHLWVLTWYVLYSGAAAAGGVVRRWVVNPMPPARRLCTDATMSRAETDDGTPLDSLMIRI